MIATGQEMNKEAGNLAEQQPQQQLQDTTPVSQPPIDRPDQKQVLNTGFASPTFGKLDNAIKEARQSDSKQQEAPTAGVTENMMSSGGMQSNGQSD